jgi:sulfate/thiosulfate-binding protein
MSSSRPSSRRSTLSLNALALVTASLAIGAVAWKNSRPPAAPKFLLNASFDPTHELFRDLNPQFTAGLLGAAWAPRTPNSAQPCTSTIVFVVRKGNPKFIRDWPDLIRKDVFLTPPDPKTSANGKLSVMAAWGSVLHRGGKESDALGYIRRLYSSEGTAARPVVADVHLTWENVALRETAESRDYQIVYPPLSIRAEPAIAWVESATAHNHSDVRAHAYLQFLFSPPAQEIIAQHGFRPVDPAILNKYAKQFPAMNLFPVSDLARDWDDADHKFFAPGGLFDLATRR